MQDAGYLLLSAFSIGVLKTFKLIYSIWGLDLHYYKADPNHKIYIINFLKFVDFILPQFKIPLGL